MALAIESRMEDAFAILELSGTLTLGPTLSGLREKARQVFNGPKPSGLILHVAAVTITDSSGLGELMGRPDTNGEPKLPNQAGELRQQPTANVRDDPNRRAAANLREHSGG